MKSSMPSHFCHLFSELHRRGTLTYVALVQFGFISSFKQGGNHIKMSLMFLSLSLECTYSAHYTISDH